MLALAISEANRDSDGELLARVAGMDDFFGCALRRDTLNDWNSAKDLGEFLIRIEPDSDIEILGQVLLVRACRHLAAPPALSMN